MSASVDGDPSFVHLPEWKRMQVVAMQLTDDALAKRRRHKDKMTKKKERRWAKKEVNAAAKQAQMGPSLDSGEAVVDSSDSLTDVQKSHILLVLDVDGVFIQRQRRPASGKPPKGWQNVPGRPWRIKVRPNASSFVRFCLSHFTVGIWSAMTIENLQPILDHVLGIQMCRELLFIWGRDRTTPSGEYDPLQPQKELVRKRFATLWDQAAGADAFKPTATLLLDDSAYKAADNPPNTSIHPSPWDGKHDRLLKKKSPLRRWLAGLAANGNVPAYVAATPFSPQLVSAEMRGKQENEHAEACAHEEGRTTKRERRRLAKEAKLAEKHARGKQTRGEAKRIRCEESAAEQAAKRAKHSGFVSILDTV